MGLVQKTIIATVAACLAATVVCGQWNCTVDPGFQTEITRNNVNSLLLNDDGTVIASGVMRFPGEFSDKRLVRLLPNGQRDPSFYNSGLGGAKLTRWQDRFYAGSATVRRILATGNQDPSFISMNLGPYFNSLQGGDYHVYPDGRVLMSGSHNLSDTARGFVGHYQLIWFTNTGYLDTTKIHRQGTGCAVYRFKELPNGQFICSGTCNQFEGQEVDWIFRVNADGTPDTTFRTDVYIGSAFDYLPLQDGRVYVAGNFRRSQAPLDTLRLARFLPDGELDPGFSIPQFSLGTLPGTFGSYGVSVQRWLDGNLLVTGKFQLVNGQPRKGICLLDTTGAVLPAFAGQGVGPYVYQGITYASIETVAYDTANAQLYICGAYNGYNDGTTNATGQRFVTRLDVEEWSTVVDEENGTSSLSLYPNPADRTVLIDWGLSDATASSAELTVMTAQGQLVHTAQMSLAKEGYTLDVTAYPAGLYHLHLVVDGQWVSGCKMIVE